MPEAKLLKVQRSDKRIDRTNRIVAIHIIFHARRKKACLIPTNASLEHAIRHTESYTRSHNPPRRDSCPASKRYPSIESHTELGFANGSTRPTGCTNTVANGASLTTTPIIADTLY